MLKDNKTQLQYDLGDNKHILTKHYKTEYRVKII